MHFSLHLIKKMAYSFEGIEYISSMHLSSRVLKCRKMLDHGLVATKESVTSTRLDCAGQVSPDSKAFSVHII